MVMIFGARSGTPGGANTQVQFNDSGVFGGDAGLTYNKTTNKLSLALGAIAVSGTAAVAATGTLTLPVNPTLADTMTIGTVTYTFVAVPAVAGDIERAATLAGTQANTVLAINGAGVNPLNRLVTCGAFAANVATITARNVGVSGNDIVTTESFTSGSNVFGAATLTGGVDDTAYIATGAAPVAIGGIRLTPGQFLASGGQPGEPTQVIGLIGTELVGDVTHVILGKFISPNEFEESMDVLPPLDNNSTFGSAARRWASGYFAQTLFMGTVNVNGFTFDVSNNRIAPNADGVADLGVSNLRFNDIFTANGFFEQSEMTAPSAPAANGVRLFAQDNGASKTQLMALFSSGAAQQVAIQDGEPTHVYKDTDQEVTSATLTADSELTVNLSTNGKYQFKFMLFFLNDGAAEGIKVSLAGTATVTDVKAQVFIYDDTLNTLVAFGRIVALGGAGIGAGVSTGSNYATIEGAIEITTAGTLLLQFAQNAAGAGAGVHCEVGSSMTVTKLE